MTTSLRYDNSLSVGEGLDRYFEASGIDASSYGKNWIKGSIGPLTVYTWNSPARKRTLPLHDIHHLVTEYGVDWQGETQVAGWELGSNCANCLVGWYFDLFVLFQSMFFAPRKALQAFLRGRRSRNLFQQTYHEGMLAENLGALRSRLGVPMEEVKATPKDLAVFALYLFMGFFIALVNYSTGLFVLSFPYLLLWFWPEQFQVIKQNPMASYQPPAQPQASP
ncbi:hypothetical protein [Stigmatella erecta]|uniref:Uncharacterized protein n=1 Tax=Stigmatella erecta TaxID=83460 RepID=A0A1I0DA97_9BACT|nr:hypothetical protein [Stigmatella erecta]SET29206.1 hypothetical protein SAMN05443639_102448 [Stigmatella erecta]